MARGDDRWVLLGDPQRRAVYDYVAASGAAVTRSAVAEALGIGRPLAAFHLDKLLHAGLLSADFRREGDRGGPGTGRPAKRYRASPIEVILTLPERRYDMAGRILARAVAETSEGQPAAEQARRVAREEGLGVGKRHGAAEAGGARRRRNAKQTLQLAVDVLDELGYRPRCTARRQVLLGNCPFHRLVEVAPDLLCGVNQAFLEGLLEGLTGGDALRARLDPSAAACCVVVEAGARPRGY